MTRLCGALLILALSPTASWAQGAAEGAVAAIRARYADVNKRIEASERRGDDGDRAGIYVNELVVNRDGEPWPASGTYRASYRFYYDFGGPEAKPLTLEKVAIRTEAGARVYAAEYLFDETGALVFVFSRAEEGAAPVERRLYFAGGKAVRTVVDGATRDRLTAADLEEAAAAARQGAQAKAVFDAMGDLPDL